MSAPAEMTPADAAEWMDECWPTYADGKRPTPAEVQAAYDAGLTLQDYIQNRAQGLTHAEAMDE